MNQMKNTISLPANQTFGKNAKGAAIFNPRYQVEDFWQGGMKLFSIILCGYKNV